MGIMIGKALAILKDCKGNIVGARLLIQDKGELDVKTSEIIKYKENLKLTNAIVMDTGFIRGKNQKLDVITINNSNNPIKHKIKTDAAKLLAKDHITVYHGCKDNKMKPTFGMGKANNDYGQGFYTTPDIELGKEWAYAAYTHGNQGYIHTFKDVDISGLRILDFTQLETEHWLAELLYYRNISDRNDRSMNGVPMVYMQKILKYCKLDTKDYDIIIGYRADDSYFSFAVSFVRGLIFEETLENALRAGNLGLQVFFKSRKAFERLRNCEHTVDKVDVHYYDKFYKRDRQARTLVDKLIRNNDSVRNQITIADIIKKYENGGS